MNKAFWNLLSLFRPLLLLPSISLSIAFKAISFVKIFGATTQQQHTRLLHQNQAKGSLAIFTYLWPSISHSDCEWKRDTNSTRYHELLLNLLRLFFFSIHFLILSLEDSSNRSVCSCLSNREQTEKDWQINCQIHLQFNTNDDNNKKLREMRMKYHWLIWLSNKSSKWRHSFDLLSFLPTACLPVWCVWHSVSSAEWLMPLLLERMISKK